MAGIDIWHLFSLHRKKVILFSLAVLISFQVQGQGQNRQFFDYSKILHFGFTLGTNVGTFKYYLADPWYHQASVHEVHMVSVPGITLGAVSDLHIGEYCDIRFIPSLILAQRNIRYVTTGDTVQPKDIESAIVEFPVLFKLKSERHNNVRYYVIAGGKYGYDLSSNYKAVKDPINPKVAVYPSNFSYEFGTGLDLYYPLFKFSPEIKFSRGINNVLYHDGTIYTNIFSSFKSNFLFISLYFEG